jgi:hypothetical protein
MITDTVNMLDSYKTIISEAADLIKKLPECNHYIPDRPLIKPEIASYISRMLLNEVAYLNLFLVPGINQAYERFVNLSQILYYSLDRLNDQTDMVFGALKKADLIYEMIASVESDNSLF